ncbi:phasin family protein [Chitinimonas sp.]|uniref:phasin family protein n=1 Tax=Chitinimonas sp. TaxID=1934313 RepID=UPI002F94F95D
MSQTPYSELAQQQLDLALQVARISIDSAEKLLQLQLDAAKEALDESAETAAKFADIKDPQAALAVRAELAEQTMGSMLGLSRNIYELAAQAQAELAKLGEARAGALQQSLLEGFDKFGKAGPAGSDALSSAFKSSISASQAAFDSLNKAARQVAEFADASLKAATTATTESVKTTKRK